MNGITCGCLLRFGANSAQLCLGRSRLSIERVYSTTATNQPSDVAIDQDKSEKIL